MRSVVPFPDSSQPQSLFEPLPTFSPFGCLFQRVISFEAVGLCICLFFSFFSSLGKILAVVSFYFLSFGFEALMMFFSDSSLM